MNQQTWFAVLDKFMTSLEPNSRPVVQHQLASWTHTRPWQLWDVTIERYPTRWFSRPKYDPHGMQRTATKHEMSSFWRSSQWNAPSPLRDESKLIALDLWTPLGVGTSKSHSAFSHSLSDHKLGPITFKTQILIRKPGDSHVSLFRRTSSAAKRRKRGPCWAPQSRACEFVTQSYIHNIYTSVSQHLNICLSVYLNTSIYISSCISIYIPIYTYPSISLSIDI